MAKITKLLSVNNLLFMTGIIATIAFGTPPAFLLWLKVPENAMTIFRIFCLITGCVLTILLIRSILRQKFKEKKEKAELKRLQEKQDLEELIDKRIELFIKKEVEPMIDKKLLAFGEQLSKVYMPLFESMLDLLKDKQ